MRPNNAILLSASPSLRRPRRDRHSADRVRRRAVDELRADRAVDQRVVLLVGHPVDPRHLEEDARLFGEHLVVLGEFADIDRDRAGLTVQLGLSIHEAALSCHACGDRI